MKIFDYFKYKKQKRRARKQAQLEGERQFLELLESDLREMRFGEGEDARKKKLKNEEDEREGGMPEQEEEGFTYIPYKDEYIENYYNKGIPYYKERPYSEADSAYYRGIIKRIKQKAAKKRRVRRVIMLTACFFIVFSVSFNSVVTKANPFDFFIRVLKHLDGKMLVNPDDENLDDDSLDFKVYQVGYMTEDYVLMSEENLSILYRAEYYKDKNHSISIEQSSKYDQKVFSFTQNNTIQETLLSGGIEYLYAINLNTGMSVLFFINNDTSIHITGTVDKEELLKIAKGLY